MRWSPSAYTFSVSLHHFEYFAIGLGPTYSCNLTLHVAALSACACGALVLEAVISFVLMLAGL
eukprot:COSAG01_NODE_46402_length_400_cov_1.531561_1_plen_62_part_01